MKSAIDVLVAVQGEPVPANCVKYKPPRGLEFVWANSTVGAMHGAFQAKEDGTLLQVSRVMVFGPRSALVAGGVQGLQRDAKLTALDYSDWAIDVNESLWGPEYVRLALVRRPISRFEEQEEKSVLR
jgi:hypothetical protein